MKFFETHYDEYINNVKKNNLHTKLIKYYSKFPKSLENLGNLIFYGPSGVGKYSQFLYSIKKYSVSDLKYEKRISLTYEKKQYFFKISDIHYEIDMSLLGCNSKALWNEFFNQVVDILSAKEHKNGIILCKNFNNIHSELLDNIYSYFQDNNSKSVSIKFILLTDSVSFIPDTILNCCEIINVSRPTRVSYNKCLSKNILQNVNINSITNIKCLYDNSEDIFVPHRLICDKIICSMLNIKGLNYVKFRDILYDIFVYNLNMYDCVWYILVSLSSRNSFPPEETSSILLKTYKFFKFYNNNYRPIYHLESYLFYLIRIINGL